MAIGEVDAVPDPRADHRHPRRHPPRQPEAAAAGRRLGGGVGEQPMEPGVELGVQAGERALGHGHARGAALPELRGHLAQVVHHCAAVEQHAQAQPARAVGPVEVLVAVGQVLLVEVAHPLGEGPLDRDVGPVEASPAGLGAADVRVVELDPAVQPLHEGGHLELGCPAHQTQHRGLALGMASVPVEVPAQKVGVGNRVVVGEQHDRGLRRAPAGVAVGRQARPLPARPPNRVGAAGGDVLHGGEVLLGGVHRQHDLEVARRQVLAVVGVEDAAQDLVHADRREHHAQPWAGHRPTVA